MEKGNTFVKSGLKKVVLRIMLIAAITGTTVGLLGCGRLTAIENNQLNLQEMINSNNQRLADNLAVIESNQRQLRGSFETGTKQIAGNLVVLEDNQLAFRSDIETHRQQLLDNTAAIENTQLEMQGGINKNARRLSDNTANIMAIGKRLLKLQQTTQNIENNAQEIVAKAAAIEQVIESRTQQTNKTVRAIEESLLKLQTKLADVQNDTSEVTTRVAAIESDQLTLKDGIETNVHPIIRNIEENQLRLQQEIESNTRQANSNAEVIEKSLLKLQNMIANVQSIADNVTARVGGIENNQLKLQDVIESNIRRVVKNIEAIDGLNESVFPSTPPEESISAETSHEQ